MKEIVLTKGKVAKVDDADYDWLNQWKWCALIGRRTVYAVRRAPGGGHLRMHRVLLNPAPGEVVDHVNHDGLDNRRSNIRTCTPGDNARNRRCLPQNKTSRFKGVCRNRQRGHWIAYISINDKFRWLGRFDNELEAARVYDGAARKFFGEFAYTNEDLGLYDGVDR